MPPYRMSSQRRRVIEVGDLVSQVIQREGAVLFSQIVKEHALRAPRPAEEVPAEAPPRFSSKKAVGEVSKWLSDVRESGLVPASRGRLQEALGFARRNLETGSALASNWSARLRDIRTLYRDLTSSTERTEFVLLLALSSASFFGGVAVGSQVPRLDVRLFPVGRRADAITVHSAPLLSLEISLQWVKAVLGRVALSPDLPSTERRRLNAMIRLCDRLSTGIETGVAARERVKKAIPFLRRRMAKVRSIPLDAQSYQMADALLAALSGIKG